MQADVSAKPKNAPRALGRLSPGRSTVIVGISDEVGAVSSQLQIEALMNPGAKLRVHMRTELTDRHRRLGVTFINVTHNQVEAMTLSNRVALMDEGRIVQHGTPSALYHDPSDLRAARFIGILAINILSDTAAAGAVSVAGAVLPIQIKGSRDQLVAVGLRP